MGDLSVEHIFAMDSKLVNQSTSVFTKIMEDLNYALTLEDFFETQRKRIDLSQIYYVTVIPNTDLQAFINIIEFTYIKDRGLWREIPSQSTPIMS